LAGIFFVYLMFMHAAADDENNCTSAQCWVLT